MLAFYKQVLKFPILFASLLLGLGGHFLAVTSCNCLCTNRCQGCVSEHEFFVRFFC